MKIIKFIEISLFTKPRTHSLIKNLLLYKPLHVQPFRLLLCIEKDFDFLSEITRFAGRVFYIDGTDRIWLDGSICPGGGGTAAGRAYIVNRNGFVRNVLIMKLNSDGLLELDVTEVVIHGGNPFNDGSILLTRGPERR